MSATPRRVAFGTMMQTPFPPLSAVAPVDSKSLDDSFGSKGDTANMDLSMGDTDASGLSFSDDDVTAIPLSKRFQKLLDTTEESVTLYDTPPADDRAPDGNSFVQSDTGSHLLFGSPALALNSSGGSGGSVGVSGVGDSGSRPSARPDDSPSSPPSRPRDHQPSPSMTPISLRPAPDQVCGCAVSVGHEVGTRFAGPHTRERVPSGCCLCCVPPVASLRS